MRHGRRFLIALHLFLITQSGLASTHNESDLEETVFFHKTYVAQDIMERDRIIYEDPDHIAQIWKTSLSNEFHHQGIIHSPLYQKSLITDTDDIEENHKFQVIKQDSNSCTALNSTNKKIYTFNLETLDPMGDPYPTCCKDLAQTSFMTQDIGINGAKVTHLLSNEDSAHWSREIKVFLDHSTWDLHDAPVAVAKILWNLPLKYEFANTINTYPYKSIASLSFFLTQREYLNLFKNYHRIKNFEEIRTALKKALTNHGLEEPLKITFQSTEQSYCPLYKDAKNGQDFPPQDHSKHYVEEKSSLTFQFHRQETNNDGNPELEIIQEEDGLFYYKILPYKAFVRLWYGDEPKAEKDFSEDSFAICFAEEGITEEDISEGFNLGYIGDYLVYAGETREEAEEKLL